MFTWFLLYNVNDLFLITFSTKDIFFSSVSYDAACNAELFQLDTYYTLLYKDWNFTIHVIFCTHGHSLKKSSCNEFMLFHYTTWGSNGFMVCHYSTRGVMSPSITVFNDTFISRFFYKNSDTLVSRKKII